MEKETVKNKLKYELELLKIYAFFIAATGTGIASLILRGNLLENKPEKYLFFLGCIIFITFVVVSINSFIQIKKLYKKL